MYRGIFIQGLCGIISINRSTITDFFGNQRTDTCQGCIDCFCNITWLFAYNISEIFFCDRQWVIFFLSLWQEIIPSRQNFTD